MKDVPRLVIQNYFQKKKREGFCALALAFFPLRIYRTTVDSVSCNYIAKL